MRTAAYEIVAGRFSMAEAARRYDAVLRRAMRRPDGAGA
jgi:hypothetical protein